MERKIKFYFFCLKLILSISFCFAISQISIAANKHFIIFYDSTTIKCNGCAKKLSDEIISLVNANTIPTDSIFYSFCGYDPLTNSLITGINHLHKPFRNKRIIPDTLPIILKSIPDDGEHTFIEIGFETTAMEYLEQYTTTSILFDDCYVITIGNSQSMFPELKSTTLSKNFPLKLSVYDYDSGDYYEESFDVRLYQLNGFTTFLRNKAYLHCDRTTTNSPLISLFLKPSAVSDSIIKITLGNNVSSIELKSYSISPLHCNNGQLTNQVSLNSSQQITLPVSFNDKQDFPLYTLLKPYLILNSDQVPDSCSMRINLNYIVHNTIYNHLRASLTLDISIYIAPPKEIPVSKVLIDNKVLKEKAHSRIMTQDEVLNEIKGTSSKLIFVAAGIIILLAAFIIWWWCKKR